MIDIEDITKIIEDGIHAPSGENCQPWRFIVTGNKIHIFNVPEADQSLYNFAQKGSYVAHGALIENIAISAAHHGYIVNVDILSPEGRGLDEDKKNLVSVISLQKNMDLKSQKVGSFAGNTLYPYIEKRCTNRKDHTAQKLSPEEKESLIDAARDSAFGEFKIIDDQTTLDILGRSLAVNEQIVFENKEVHDFFYDHILWKDEDQDRSGGFYIKTLEFLPHQLKGVKLFKNWKILNFLNKIGKVSQKIAKENAEKYAKSGALAAVIIAGNDERSFIKAGRTIERIWLTATQLGLSVHPCTGVLYFNERIIGGDKDSFSQQHQDVIKQAYADIARAFSAGGKTIPMLFRLGHADAPTAQARRIKPDITIK